MNSATRVGFLPVKTWFKPAKTWSSLPSIQTCSCVHQKQNLLLIAQPELFAQWLSMNYIKKNKIMYYLYIVIWGSFWLILYSKWYRRRETELFVAVTVRLMDWTLVNNSLYLRWLLLCSLYSLIIFSVYVNCGCIHIHYNSVENLHWQKLAETCFCRTGLNHGLNHLRQKPANPVCNWHWLKCNELTLYEQWLNLSS